jgi:histone H3/H4
MAEKRDLIVKSAVRELVKDMRISDSFFDALNKAVEELVKKAIERAKANGRATLRGEDV